MLSVECFWAGFFFNSNHPINLIENCLKWPNSQKTVNSSFLYWKEIKKLSWLLI
jgi:hypothetical protein